MSSFLEKENQKLKSINSIRRPKLSDTLLLGHDRSSRMFFKEKSQNSFKTIDRQSESTLRN